MCGLMFWTNRLGFGAFAGLCCEKSFGIIHMSVVTSITVYLQVVVLFFCHCVIMFRALRIKSEGVQ